MNARALRLVRPLTPFAQLSILVAMLAACTGTGGGYLPPGSSSVNGSPPTSFNGRASFGFDFSCEDKGGVNPPTGRLHIQLSYNDAGTSLLLGAPFSLHGVVDQLDPVLESAVCIGTNPPPGGSELIFLGRYGLTSSPPPGFPTSCPSQETQTTPLCRFEVLVKDNDGSLTPSSGDFFSIQLSSTTAVSSELQPATVFYARAGVLAGGNITVS